MARLRLRRPATRRVATPPAPAGAAAPPPGGGRAVVLVDGRLARRRSTGVATYINELRRVMEETAPSDLSVEFVFGPPGLPRLGRVTSFGNLVVDLLWLHVVLPLRAARSGAKVLHAPVNWAPWWSPCPVVVTVQDLSFERMPEAYPDGFRRYASFFARRSARRAARVIATSEATAADLRELYRVPDERIRVIPIGVELDTATPREREPFILSVGVLDPRKRITALVEGHARYLAQAPAQPPPCRLIIVGTGGGDEESVRRAAGSGCELRGFVDRAELRELYRRATLLVYPSAYEGFGLPVAEAMAHGCPVLIARNSSLIEVGGSSALFFDDPTPEGIAAALLRVLGDRDALAERGVAAREEAARFSWPSAATATRDVYRQAMRMSPRDDG